MSLSHRYCLYENCICFPVRISFVDCIHFRMSACLRLFVIQIQCLITSSPVCMVFLFLMVHCTRSPCYPSNREVQPTTYISACRPEGTRDGTHVPGFLLPGLSCEENGGIMLRLTLQRIFWVYKIVVVGLWGSYILGGRIK